MKRLFQENQRFNQWWVWLLLAVSSAAPVIILYKKITSNAADSGSLLAVIVLSLVIALFAILRIKTTVTDQSIQLVYFPFVWKTINLSDIETMQVINYGFVGGWGIRFGTIYGTVYNVSGNKGLHIKLKNGKQLVIGTLKTNELEKIIKNINHTNS